MSPIRIESPGEVRVALRYLVFVVLLLAVIIGVLTQLWLIERNRRVTAEDRYMEMYLKDQMRQAAETAITAPSAPAAGEGAHRP